MAWISTETMAGLPPINTIDTAAKAAVGTIVTGQHETYGAGELIYLKGVASTVLGSWVTYNHDDGSTTLLAANAIGPVAIAMAITVADRWGWYQISGKAVGKAAAAFADNGNVYATATGGIVDDAIVAGDRVKNAVGASAVDTPSTGLAEFEINRPFMDDAVAA